MSAMTYARHLATGDMVPQDGDTEITRSDELIYEFMYPRATFKGHI